MILTLQHGAERRLTNGLILYSRVMLIQLHSRIRIVCVQASLGNKEPMISNALATSVSMFIYVYLFR